MLTSGVTSALATMMVSAMVANPICVMKTTDAINVRACPYIESSIEDVYYEGKEVDVLRFIDGSDYKWAQIAYANRYGYICADYLDDIKDEEQEYVIDSVSQFKSYMDYRCLSSNSDQGRLQKQAVTSPHGLRMVDGRYTVAIGTRFGCLIGDKFDLVLKNNTVIPCIVGDIKRDIDTDSTNTYTIANGCVSEFIVDTKVLYNKAKVMGDVSYCDDSWLSPVVKIKVYED